MKVLHLAAFICAAVVSAIDPSFSNIVDQRINQNEDEQTITISGISRGDAISNTLTFFVSSTNTELFPEEFLDIDYIPGSSSSQLQFRPAQGVSGTATILVILSGEDSKGDILIYSEEFVITVTKTDMDCEYSNYGSWSTCDQICNGGRQTRTRSIVQQPMGKGARCDPASQVQTRACNQQLCQPPTINQIMDQTIQQDSGSYYVDLTGISAGAGESDQDLYVKVESSNPNLVRINSNTDIIYKSPASTGKLWFTASPGQSGSSSIIVTVSDTGGASNAGSSQATSSFVVNVVPTPVDCLYEWGEYGQCSTSCGDGYRTRDARVIRRASQSGQQCPSPLPRETRPCYMGACPVNCEKTWGEWQACSVSCGTGEQTRYEVVKSYPTNGGEGCGTLETMTRKCTQRSCPVDCQTEWSEWSECSQTCGIGGTSFRQRTIKTPASNGGKQCPSPLDREERSCNMEVCPGPEDCQMGPWTEWDMCGSDCKHVRNRRVVREARNNGVCGALMQEESCSGEQCQQGSSRHSCERKCGSEKPQGGGCACDADCLRYNDCCSDYARFCQIQPVQQGGCMGRCGGAGFGGNCYCDVNCERNGDCCGDYRIACGFGTNNAYGPGINGGAFGTNNYRPNYLG